MSTFERALRELKANLIQRIGSLFRRGEITLCGQDFFIQFSGLKDEPYDGVELFQQYGFASRPPVGSEVLVLHVAGLGELAIGVATSNRTHRPADLEEGEASFHGPKLAGGQAEARAKTDGTLALRAATGKVVEVGGADAKIPKGEDLNAAIKAFIDAVAACLVGAPLGVLALDPLTVTAIKGQLDAALATKGKVA